MEIASNTCAICGRIDSPLLDGICSDCKAKPPAIQLVSEPAPVTVAPASPAPVVTRYSVPLELPVEATPTDSGHPTKSWWSGVGLIICGLLMSLVGIGIVIVVATDPPPPSAAPVMMMVAVPLLFVGEIFLLAGTIRWAVAPLWERLDQLSQSLGRKD